MARETRLRGVFCALLLALLMFCASAASAELRRGDSGDGVYALQELLFESGWLFELPDGAFGRNTEQAVKDAFAAYDRLVKLGIPAEDARYLLPNACETKIVITMNIRELLHFFSLRCCNRAQWEIREMACRMLELARPTAPYIFQAAGPGCVRGACPEGAMCCGQPWEEVAR